MKQIFKILAAMLISISAGYSQPGANADSTIVSIASQFSYGKILPHSKSIADLTGSYLWGWQADVSRTRYTKAAWSVCNCYSQNGFSLSYFNFNNPEELGGAINLAVFAEPQLTRGRLFLSLRGGMGVSYLTRVYHPDRNSRNLFFSTPWSGLLLVQLSTRYRLTPQWSVRLSTSYQHISNGGQRQPNKGMNFPTVWLGVDYATKHQDPPARRRHANPDESMQYYVEMSYNTRSLREIDATSDERKIVLGLHGGVYKPIAHMHALGVGFELSHDGLLEEFARQEPDSYDPRVLSGLLMHHLLFGRFDFSQAIGFYIHKAYPEPNTVFQRYAMHYQISDNFRAGFTLKAHLHTAEQMDVRLGVTF